MGTFATVRLVACTPSIQGGGAARGPADGFAGWRGRPLPNRQNAPPWSPAAAAAPGCAQPRPFALKTLSKEKLVRNGQVEHTINEARLLSELK
eukprot:scaffold31367_cov160-Isochrysis_galbana.AAC.2